MIDTDYLLTRFRNAYDLAKRVGLSDPQAYRLIARRDAPLGTVIKIARYLNVPIDKLINKEGEPK